MGIYCSCPDGPGTVDDCLGVSCGCLAGLGDFLAASLNVWESSSSAQTVLAPSHTVSESPAGASPV
ncbi:hypothetical protein DPMN_045086 [Dreissena polymorpha]|uniref:Uncharacterized protein n=1 Tax=Dreissena polymorpha TaxID=45954 RepID=A0A9D4D469_DREPO|nr:hypothetical protein DPMN_045086 [Dreissena polymorpha]